MSQPRLVQAVDRRDPLDPSLAPVRQSHLAGRALDKIAAHMGPTECKGHLALAKASESLVGAIAIATMTVSRRASPNSFCAASALREGSIWKETASLLTETHSQARLERSSPRSSWTRQLVSSAWRSAALFWCARIAGQRLEQRHEPLQAVGQRPRRDRQPLGGHPRGNAVHGAEAGTVLEQEACPEAGPVERPGEQPRTGGADTSMGDDAHSQVRRQRGRRITRL